MKPFNLEEANLNKHYCVYRHTLPDGRCYIGMSSNIEKRWQGISSYLRCKLFYSEIKKHNRKDIKHEIIKSNLTIKEASALEDQLILEAQKENISLNISRGGIGGSHPAWNKGVPLSKERRNALIKANKGKIVSEETRRKISESRKGHEVSAETRRKIGVKNSRPHTKEHREKIDMANKYRWIKVSVYKGKEFIGTYESIKKMVAALGFNVGNLYRALKKANKYKGFTIIKEK